MQLSAAFGAQTRHSALTAPPLRPVVVVTILYAQLLALWFLWLACTATLPRIGATEPFHIYSTLELGLTSVIDVALVLWLVADLVGVGRAPVGLVRARVAGGLCGLALVASIQTLALLAHDVHAPPIWLMWF